MKMVENLFVNNRGMVTIHELGWYLRAQNVIKGLPDI
jgi:hypothetical protein